MTLRFLGKEYSTKIVQSPLLRNHGFCEFVDGDLHVHVPAKLTKSQEKAAILHAIQTWYQKAAAQVFDARANLYAGRIGTPYKSIKLADPKSRWGSCGRDGRLMFSWRAVMLPIDIIDYLIVHELCHLIHFNHSKAYWHTVESILPDYKTRRAQLRQAEGNMKIIYRV